MYGNRNCDFFKVEWGILYIRVWVRYRVEEKLEIVSRCKKKVENNKVIFIIFESGKIDLIYNNL